MTRPEEPSASAAANWSKDAAEACFAIIGDSAWTFESSATSIERFEAIIDQHAPAIATESANLTARLREALEAMKRIEDLWLPKKADSEHEHEAIALHSAARLIDAALTPSPSGAAVGVGRKEGAT